ncbi:MAG: DUF4148 domain-containing protein [Xanthomonadales bacterium]|nr:DUF4148 domain-containing protein [Xanthomonadales bacterium]ODU92771.1 MAG: hypothetical protein ABT18_11095 [Rhodanobacter sp. SCN 66-43]OJY83863.1 MAG: hypothetical protein BGP23_14740 [Xanthomonadales bacterium 66-474]
MKCTTLAISVFATVALASGQAASAGQPPSSAPTRAEVDQQAMQEGPTTGRIGYLTHKDPPAPHRAAAPVDPRMLRPLTKREIGMLFNACIAYAECKTAYAKAYEHHQALLRAQQASAEGEP